MRRTSIGLLNYTVSELLCGNRALIRKDERKYDVKTVINIPTYVRLG